MGCIRLAYRMWSEEPSNGCPTLEKPQVAQFTKPNFLLLQCGRVLKNCWSSVYAGIFKKLVVISVKDYGWIPSNRRDEFVNSKGKQAKMTFSLPISFLSGLLPGRGAHI